MASLEVVMTEVWGTKQEEKLAVTSFHSSGVWNEFMQSLLTIKYLSACWLNYILKHLLNNIISYHKKLKHITKETELIIRFLTKGKAP